MSGITCTLCRRCREDDWNEPESFKDVVGLCAQCSETAIKTLEAEIRAAVLAVIR